MADAVTPTPATDWTEKAFTFASDIVKQVLTLASAILGVTVTFQKDILLDQGGWTERFLKGAWGALAVCVVFGLLALGAMTGQFASRQGAVGPPSVNSGSTRAFAIMQLLAFGIAIVLVMVFALTADFHVPTPAATSP